MIPKSPEHRKLGERIKYLRGKLDMTQEELAFKVGVDRSYMGFVERGERNPTFDVILRISRSLGTSLSKLFDF